MQQERVFEMPPDGEALERAPVSRLQAMFMYLNFLFVFMR